MQSLGHHCTSFSSPNFSSSERRTASASSDTLAGQRRRGSTSVDGPETTGKHSGRLRGCVLEKFFGIPPLRCAAGRFPAGSSGTVTFLKGKRRIFQDLSIPNPSIHIPSGGECCCSCVEKFATHSQ